MSFIEKELIAEKIELGIVEREFSVDSKQKKRQILTAELTA